MIKVIGRAGDNSLLAVMDDMDFRSLQSSASVDYDWHVTPKISESFDVKAISKLHDDFKVMSELKSEIKTLLTKWQTVVSRMNVIDETKKK